LEVDRRIITKRIEFLKAELEKVRDQRMRYRQRRKKSQIPVVALVGYTNAGKSTLLNKLSDSDVYVADQYFATLDPTTRRVDLPGGQTVLLTDTVGFIQKLPTELVAAFRATLEEISEADVLLHLVDITHANAEAQVKSVHETLLDIGAGDVPMVFALNKIDMVKDTASERAVIEGAPDGYPVSALTGKGLEELLSAVECELFESYIELDVQIPYQEGQLLSLFHEFGQVQEIQSVESGTWIKGLLPRRLFFHFEPYLNSESDIE